MPRWCYGNSCYCAARHCTSCLVLSRSLVAACRCWSLTNTASILPRQSSSPWLPCPGAQLYHHPRIPTCSPLSTHDDICCCVPSSELRQVLVLRCVEAPALLLCCFVVIAPLLAKYLRLRPLMTASTTLLIEAWCADPLHRRFSCCCCVVCTVRW
jgi:hypothetical protein